MQTSIQNPELSIVLPCLNEELTVGICVKKAINFLKKNKIDGEVIVADNRSTDNSKEIAKNAGVKVVEITAKGYANAVMYLSMRDFQIAERVIARLKVIFKKLSY